MKTNLKKSKPNKLIDFRNFLYLVWRHLNLPEPTPIQYDIANYIQNGPRQLVIEAFRGVGKSYIVSLKVSATLLQNFSGFSILFSYSLK